MQETQVQSLGWERSPGEGNGTSDEISNMIELPEKLSKNWYTRQYYGTVAHNSKAVYQKYMGWYDANPVNLNPLTPTESAKKWVEYLGDVDEVPVAVDTIVVSVQHSAEINRKS